MSPLYIRFGANLRVSKYECQFVFGKIVIVTTTICGFCESYKLLKIALTFPGDFFINALTLKTEARKYF